MTGAATAAKAAAESSTPAELPVWIGMAATAATASRIPFLASSGPLTSEPPGPATGADQQPQSATDRCRATATVNVMSSAMARTGPASAALRPMAGAAAEEHGAGEFGEDEARPEPEVQIRG